MKPPLLDAVPRRRRSSGSPAVLGSRWARLGLAGFLFFLIKGLLWLVVTAALWNSV